MKKLLLLATLVLGVVSCMKDQPVEAGLTGDGNIVLSVGLPADATRAAGTNSALGAIDNGLDLTKYDIRYILEVFDANKTLAKRVENFEDTATETTFELRLIPGRHYRFVVWADFVKDGVERYIHLGAETMGIGAKGLDVFHGITGCSTRAETRGADIDCICAMVYCCNSAFQIASGRKQFNGCH